MKLLKIRRLPIFVEMYIFIVFTLLVPLAVVTINNNEKLLQYSEAEIIQSAQNNLNSTEKLMNLVCNNVITTTINLSKDPLISDISNLSSYSQFQTNSNHMGTIRKVANKLKVMEYSDTLFFSIYFYLKESDYLITTKNDTVHLDTFYDLEWLHGIKEKGLSDKNAWIARKLPFDISSRFSEKGGYTRVVSFLYHTTHFTTNAKGLFVVNIYEKELSNIINNSGFDENSSVFVINESGKVISHIDESLFNTDLSNIPYIQNILEQSYIPGYIIDSSNDQRTLYCFLRSEFNDWIYISTHSLDLLMNRSKVLQNQALILTFGISLLFFLAAYFFSRRMTTPIRKLMNTIISREGYKMENKTNEIDFLVKAFDQISEQEEYLNSLVKKSEISLKEIYLLKLLKGNAMKYENNNDIQTEDIFTHYQFMVAMVVVDNEQAFNNRYTPDQRFFLRMLMKRKCDEINAEGIQFFSVLYDEDKISMIINLKAYDCIKTPELLKKVLVKLQDDLQKSIGNSVSIGVSGCHSNPGGIQEAASEAMETVRRKLLLGHKSLIFWTGENTSKSKYYYPFSRENHILNYLNSGYIDRVETEIHAMVQEIKNIQDISCENILQVFNQLISATIKYFVDSNTSIARTFPNIYSIYREIAEKETLEDLENYMVEFYRKAHSLALPIENSEKNTKERVLNYLNSHYKTEIIFEEMATDLQISYSYIRKIVKEVTGKSVLDYINNLRVSEGKRLLQQTNMSILEIAQNLGHNNVQSFNRYFKKFEGITPGEFRSRL